MSEDEYLVPTPSLVSLLSLSLSHLYSLPDPHFVPVFQALITALGNPLLSHSIHVPSIDMSEDEYLVPDTGTLMDMYGNKGLDFIVEVGQRKTRPSSVSVCDGRGEGGGECW
jgi:hypothetical protein